ncbi:hypothetical protein RAD15_24315 [Bradyrhizobium sp. 14AA]
MKLRKWIWLAAGVPALTLGGCGTYVPQMQEAWETTRTPVLTAGGDLEYKIREKIYCDIVQAVHDNDILLPSRWGVQTTVDLQVDETGALNPGVSFIEPLSESQSRSLGLGATLSSQGTREDKFSTYWNLDKLRRFSGGTCAADRPSFHGSSLLLESELGISSWLRDRLQTERALPSSQIPSDAGDTFKQDVMSYHIKFVVISSGTVNPAWKLVRISVGDGSTLLTANRTRTHDLLVFARIRDRERRSKVIELLKMMTVDPSGTKSKTRKAALAKPPDCPTGARDRALPDLPKSRWRSSRERYS